MKTAEIREKFLNFFENKGHTRVPSSSLVPHNDPTLLFSNAGMNQFKDVFLGFDSRPYKRATTVQKCVRAGGKHNDLENVGYTARHLTFFEMLGNFSFGDYFKKEAIEFAWEFLTSPKWLSIPKEKLLVTVYAEDEEAFLFWHKNIGLPTEKIIRIGDNKGGRYASDNFWQMGDTGPCGPCSEIFYDHGDAVFGGPPGSKDEDGDRFVEIWNCVFMQYNRDDKGSLTPLPKPSVDTGMGLERITAVMQKVYSNFEIDLFQNLIKAVATVTDSKFALNNASLNVIADHIRTCSFLIADGILPGNEGRAYVLRRIIRRASRHGYKLGKKTPFFYKLVPALVKEMGQAYSELIEKQQVIEQTLLEEEERFSLTLSNGLNYLQAFLSQPQSSLSGDVAFKLYDTYGFPLDLTIEICREKGIVVDEVGFQKEMGQQKKRARQASQFKSEKQFEYSGQPTIFLGYEQLSLTATIIALFDNQGEPVEELNPQQSGTVVLDKTPFYAEGGGQIGDRGQFVINQQEVFVVNDTQKIKADVIGHFGDVLKQSIKLGDEVLVLVEKSTRLDTMRNHSATHLLHKALWEVLGKHVEQRGSLVTDKRLRFDFAHLKPLTGEELKKIENLVNQQVLADLEVEKTIQSYDEAIKSGAMALFGEKYGNEVCVVKMGEFSTELCGGTHVKRTGEIGLFKILTETGIASGVRRIEAITGNNSLFWLQEQERIISIVLGELKAQTSEDVIQKIQDVLSKNKQLEKSLIQMRSESFKKVSQSLIENAQQLGNYRVIIKEYPYESSILREVVSEITAKADNLIVIFFSYLEGKTALCVGVSKELVTNIKANELIKILAESVDGRGGGRADIAQAGATTEPSEKILKELTEKWLAEK